MKLSIQFLTLTIAMAALAIAQGTSITPPACIICSIDDKTKADYLTFQYVPQGVDSEYHDSSKSSCVGGSYPNTTTLEVTTRDGDTQSFDVQLGSIFTVGGRFGSNATFFFSDGTDCTIHTSCSAPLVTGDQIGPFKVLGGKECGNFATFPPTGPADDQCVICSVDDKTKPDYLTIEYVPQGFASQYQDSSKASCLEGSYPPTTTLEMTNKDGDTQSFDVELGSVFTVVGPFDANTEIFFRVDLIAPFTHHVPLRSWQEIRLAPLSSWRGRNARTKHLHHLRSHRLQHLRSLTADPRLLRHPVHCLLQARILREKKGERGEKKKSKAAL